MPNERRRLGSRTRRGRRHRRPQRLDPGEPHLALDRAVVLEPQAQQQRPQRQTLEHERAEHDAERRDEDQVAKGEHLGRQRERRGERHRAAHAAPPHNRRGRAAMSATASLRPGVPSARGRQRQRLNAAAPVTHAMRARMTATHTAAATAA